MLPAPTLARKKESNRFGSGKTSDGVYFLNNLDNFLRSHIMNNLPFNPMIKPPPTTIFTILTWEKKLVNSIHIFGFTKACYKDSALSYSVNERHLPPCYDSRT